MPSRSAWDARYRAAGAGLPPVDPFLGEARAFLPDSSPGACTAVDVASGSGRHSLELARWGLRTLALDFSSQSLRICRERAQDAGLPVEVRCVDLEAPDFDLGSECFDVVAVFNFLHRPLIPALRRATRRGGIVIYKTFTLRQREFGTGPRNPDHLLVENELAELFGGFRQLLYRETCENEATAALIARRP